MHVLLEIIQLLLSYYLLRALLSEIAHSYRLGCKLSLQLKFSVLGTPLVPPQTPVELWVIYIPPLDQISSRTLSYSQFNARLSKSFSILLVHFL